jgi:hypothetical protein
MLITRMVGATAVIALSSLSAFGQSAQIAAVSGRDQLALHDLATGAELARLDAPGGSSDLLALGSGVALSNHTAGNEVVLVDLNRRAEIGRLPSSSLGGIRPVHMYLSPVIEGRQYAVVLNDGNERSTPKGERPKDSTLVLIDAVQSSPTFLKPMGEIRLGIRGGGKPLLSLLLVQIPRFGTRWAATGTHSAARFRLPRMRSPLSITFMSLLRTRSGR